MRTVLSGCCIGDLQDGQGVGTGSIKRPHVDTAYTPVGGGHVASPCRPQRGVPEFSNALQSLTKTVNVGCEQPLTFPGDRWGCCLQNFVTSPRYTHTPRHMTS